MKIKMKADKFQIVIELISAGLLILMFVYLILRWDSVPDRIPGHYNAAGEVTRWGSKGELLLLPIISAVLYLLLTVIGFVPAIWNVPVGTTEEKQKEVYHNAKNMLLIMKVEFLVCFFYLQYSETESKALTPLFTVITLTVLFITILYFILKMYKVAK